MTLLVLGLFVASTWAQTEVRPELPKPEERPMLIEPSPIGDIEYRPGRGLKLGDTRFTLGGFGTATATRIEGERGRFGLQDLNLFVFFDPTEYLHVFSDFAFDKLFDIDDSGINHPATADASVERLYVDLNLDDRANFRLGKFLTPLGRWNQIPAEPLTWTTSRPVVTNGPFDQQVTGAEFWGSLFPSAGALTYSAYGQFLPALPTAARAPDAADDSAGARLEFTGLQAWSVGASYFGFTRQGRWNHLGGLDQLWRGDRAELSTEFLVGRGDPDGRLIFGGYLQGAVEITHGIHAVGRYEHFDPGSPDPAVDLFDLGLAWRPLPFLIFKAEYLLSRQTSRLAEPGILSSLSLLF